MRKTATSLLFILFICQSIVAKGIECDTIELQNEYLSIKIATKGAEVISAFSKKENLEHLWQGDPSAWANSSPILFPIVGKLKDGHYFIDGKEYKMKNHGFASKSFFTIVSKSDTEVVLKLEYSEETLKMYPYKFRLMVHYSLEGSRLLISNTVENIDNKQIYFSIGAHPGFNIPFYQGEEYNDYYLEFDQIESVARLPLTKKKGLLSNTRIDNYLDHSNRLNLSHELFKDRVIILEGLRSSTVSIKSNHSKTEIKIGIQNFPFIGVWTASKTNAPFVCIEPWYGLSDKENTNGDFKLKKGIRKLDPKKQFTMEYFIEIIN